MAVEIKKINGVYMGSQELASTALATDTSLKAYYRFSTGALTTDSSSGGHTLTAISDPAEGTGKFGGGVDLDGNDAYSATDHADFKPTGAFSVGGWYKTTGTSFQVLFASYSANSNYAGIHMGTTGTTYYPYISSNRNTGTTENTDYVNCVGTKATNDNSWHFMVGVWNTSSLLLYVDGVLAKSVSWANAPGYAGTNYVRVGCRNTTGTDASFFTGSLDDLFLLNGKALTSDEIYSLYKTGVKKLNGQVNLNPELESTSLRGDANLVGYWRMEGNSLDETANNFDGTDTNITYGTAYGKFGQGSSFNGTSSIITTNYNSSPKSINIWFKSSLTGNSWGPLISQRTSDSVGWTLRHYYGTNNLDIKIGTTDRYWGNSSTINIFDGNWHMITLVTDDTNTYEYTDGVLVYTIAGVVFSASGNLQFGANNWDNIYYLGNLDDISIFSRALTATEISNLYNTNIKKYNGVSNV